MAIAAGEETLALIEGRDSCLNMVALGNDFELLAMWQLASLIGLHGV